jgi:hypothetical protein
MDFYRFWEILSENKNEWNSSPEPSDNPPEYTNWSDRYTDDDLKWTDWEEDGVTVKLVGGHFFDARNKPMPFLDQYANQVQNWDQTRGISLDYERMYGTIRGAENPRTGEGWDDETVRVELKNPVLSDYANPQNKIELPDSILGNIKSHFFKRYE